MATTSVPLVTFIHCTHKFWDRANLHFTGLNRLGDLDQWSAGGPSSVRVVLLRSVIGLR